MPKPPGQTVFELKVMLADVEPSVSRRLLVPGPTTLGELHDILQVSMGWTNSHLHSLGIGAERFGPQDDDDVDGEIDEAEVLVLSAIGAHETFVYEYDPGDAWDHNVAVERVSRLSRASSMQCAWAGRTLSARGLRWERRVPRPARGSC